MSRRQSALTCAALMAVVASGCGPSEVRPPGDAVAARTTLTQVLDAWKAGKAPADLRSSDPAVYANDEDWAAGRKLSTYAIVGEPVQNGGEWRVFASLTLAGSGAPKSPQRVCYSVSPGSPANVSRSDYLN
jgi:hypothetical protein